MGVARHLGKVANCQAGIRFLAMSARGRAGQNDQRLCLEVWPESHWTRFLLTKGDGLCAVLYEHGCKPRLVGGQRRTMEERSGELPEEAWREITVAEGSQGPRSLQPAGGIWHGGI